MMKKSFGLIVFMFVFTIFPAFVNSQVNDSSRKAILLNTALENLQTLRQYSWTMKGGMSLKDSNAGSRLFLLKWTKDGSLLKTEKAGGRVVADDLENKLINAVAEMVVKYMGPADSKLTAFYKGAQLNPDTGGLVELNGGDFMLPEDKVTIDADKTIYIIRRITFTTTFEEDDLMGTIDYAVDNAGFKHPAKVKVDIPAKRATIVFENIDFIKN